MNRITYLLSCLVLSSPLLSSQLCLAETVEVALDSVIASVNNQPITLKDLSQSFSPARNFTLEQASTDPQAHAELDKLILELLVETDAKSRRLEVSEDDVEAYISEVAKRNQLERAAFEEALAKENISLIKYKQRVRNEILRSRLANTLMREGVGVSDQEINEYLEGRSTQAESQRRLKLRQILLAPDALDESAAEQLANEIHQKLEAGADFASLAQEYSQGSEAEEGGLIGIVAESDLSQDILDAVLLVPEGGISRVVKGPLGYQIFKVDQRYEGKENQDALREATRKELEKRKLEVKLDNYFRVELFEKYAVERKI